MTDSLFFISAVKSAIKNPYPDDTGPVPDTENIFRAHC